jgi:SNF family Na+-dependent transporter
MSQSWSSRIGVILAVTGSAVGLGNFLKFPGQLATWGGGFLIPYFVALVAIGLPLAWVEWTLGRQGGQRGMHSVPGILLALTRRRWLSALSAVAPLIPLMIYCYYVLIEAWCLGYAWQYLSGGLGAGTDFGAHFGGYVGAGADAAVFANGSLLAALGLCLAGNLAIIWLGVAKGIERVCTWGMPLLVLCALAIVVRVLTLDPVGGRTVMDALGAVWNPDRTLTLADGTVRTVTLAQTLANPDAWLAAAGQIFFTLSLGMGVLITYASYMKPDDDIALSSTTACAGNEFCEVGLGGMLSIPAAYLFLGSTILIAVPGLFGLGFVSLPHVFAQMPGGPVWGFLFFTLLFLAAITSSLSMIQPAMAFLEEGLGLTRRGAVTAVGLLTLPGVLLAAWLTRDFTGLDTMDFWMGTVGILVCALAIALVFGWVIGARQGLAELRRGAEIPVPGVFAPLVRYVVPLFLVAVLGAFLVRELAGGGRLAALADPRVALPFAYIVACTLLAVVLGFRAQRRLAARLEHQP